MRDNRLDVIRGLAILWLTITHTVPGPQLLEQYGHYYILSGFFFHGADIFVSFSGLVCGIVYKRTIEKAGTLGGIRKGLVRAAQLFFYNAAAFLAAFCIVAAFSSFGVQAPRHSIDDSWISAFFGTVFLYQPIAYFNILNIYILFLLILPFFVAAQMRSNLPIFFCIALYLGYTLYRMSGGTDASESIFFVSPFSWQLAFFGGAFIGMNLDRIREAAPPLRLTIGPIMVYVLAAHFMRDQSWIVHNFSGKFQFGALRIVDLILLAYLIDQLVRPSVEITSHTMQKLSSIGSNSLFCFAFTLVICYFFSHVLTVFDGNRAIYLAVLLLEVMIVMQLGKALISYNGFRAITQVRWIERTLFPRAYKS